MSDTKINPGLVCDADSVKQYIPIENGTHHQVDYSADKDDFVLGWQGAAIDQSPHLVWDCW